MPPGTSVGQLAAAGLSPGVMSAGIGHVHPEQTYLDISQGNRVADSLYDGRLPSISASGPSPTEWRHILERAASAPANIVPGSLGSALLDGNVGSRVDPILIAEALIAVNRDGMVARASPGPGLTVRAAGDLRRMVARLHGEDLLIAFRAPSSDDEAVPVGIAGRGFSGNLTSDSTRTDGYVLSTDIAPTILHRFGLPVPDEMDGQPIRSDGRIDVAAIEDRVARMTAIPDRRAPLVIGCLAAWILAALLVNRIVFGLRRPALAWLGLCFAYMPLMLLAGAWLRPSAIAEGLVIGLGAAVLAAVTVRFAPGWRGMAIACGITVIAYALDVFAGSPLTKLSLLGPNPILGVRFYGIGNELEALISVMVPVGVGAALTAVGVKRCRTAAAAFLCVGAVAALIFAAGRFGADVGAAIVLAVGAAVAASLTSGGRRHLAIAVVSAPLVAVAALALVDLVSGGNAHLTRSVLDAGGAGDFADIAQRRLELSADDFVQAAGNPLFWIVIVGIALALAQRGRIDTWLQQAPFARAGVIGACAAVAAGVLVNDSGATFLVLGSLALGAALAFAWAQAQRDP
jgi:hypothetical protein